VDLNRPRDSNIFGASNGILVVTYKEIMETIQCYGFYMEFNSYWLEYVILIGLLEDYGALV